METTKIYKWSWENGKENGNYYNVVLQQLTVYNKRLGSLLMQRDFLFVAVPGIFASSWVPVKPRCRDSINPKP